MKTAQINRVSLLPLFLYSIDFECDKLMRQSLGSCSAISCDPLSQIGWGSEGPKINSHTWFTMIIEFNKITG